jgi:hypothetical protein
MSRRNKYFVNTGPVKSWAKFFNSWKSPNCGYFISHNREIKEEFPRKINGKSKVREQLLSNNKITLNKAFRILKCNRINNS